MSRHAGLPTDWPPSAPGDPGWAGDTPWAGGHAPARRVAETDIDVLNPLFPIGHSQPPAIFWQLLRRPPADSQWAWSRPGFAIDESRRADASARVPQESFVVPMPDTAPIPVVQVPRTYRELEPDTLAHEYADTELAWTLGDGEYLP